jgi:phage terminase large subunit GpA-like protein
MVIQGLLDALRPTKILTVDKWADENRVLTTESAAEAGKWRTSRTPYLRQILEDLSPTSPIQKVILSKGAQLGLSESALNAVGCYMDIAPCPIMYVMPTIDLAEALSKDRLDPMILNCASLAKKVPSKGKEGGNTILVKSFPGGRLSLAGANSAASLRSRAVRVLMLDEVDAYPLDLDGEGSPVKLAEKRTSTFGDRRKIYMLSTPTIEGESVIDREINETEIQKYHIPCPECGAMQPLVWEQMKWEEGNPDTVRYECAHCGEHFEERHKTRFLAQGVWVPTFPEKQKRTTRGYHINGLYSPYGWYSWAEAVADWEEALKDATNSKMKTFVNTVLGETFKQEGEAPDWERLYERREEYQTNEPPMDVAFLTAGADVQRDRIEVEIVGWCEGKRTYSIDFRVFLGDTTQPEVWEKLRALLQERWKREDGADLGLRLLAVDSGYNTQHVYDFCRKVGLDRAFPIKGSDTQDRIVGTPRDVIVGQTGKKVPGLKLWTIGVAVAKSELYGWLRQTNTGDAEPDGYCHFPQYDQRYFRGLTAEIMRPKLIRGYRRYEWVKLYDRNEPLDCRVYARAAAAVFGMDRMDEQHWKRVWEEGVQVERVEVKAKPKKEGGGFLNRWRKD